MAVTRQNPAVCMLRSHRSQQLLSYRQYKPPSFLAPALYSYSTQAKPDEAKQSPTTTLRQSSSPPTHPAIALNPPSSTLPPPLSLPASEPNVSGTAKFKFYYRIGRAYLTFYKSGVKAIWQNYKTLRQLRPHIPRGSSTEQALRDGLLSRAEYHLIRRTRSDMSRIPVFGLVLTICGEFTPLVVVFIGLSGAVPRTCHIPRQIDGARKKLEARRRESFREGTVTPHEIGKLKDAQQLPTPILVHIGRSLNLYSSLWDRIGVVPTNLLPRRIQRAVDRIDVDDLAINRAGGVKYLNEEETKLAAEERGLDIVGRPTGELKSLLGHWIDARQRSSIIDLLSRRPSVWP
ncbi:MAG: hypothetical protein Q9166_000809 [cf. Caloplaca sp. 2 TL-2023]